MKTTEERLVELLDAKDEYIGELEVRVSDLEKRLDAEPRWVEQLPDDGGLPVPRLEIRWIDTRIRSDGYPWLVRYDLVYQHMTGDYIAVTLGSTRTTKLLADEPIDDDGRITLPFRDGAHIKHDAIVLGLPAFVRWGDHVQRLDPMDHAGVVGVLRSRGQI